MTSMEVVGDLLRERAREQPGKLLWWVGEDRATYAEADAKSDRVAAGLAEIGVRQGDRVAILSTNRREYLEVIFGLAKLGAVQVPLNAYLRGDFLAYQIGQAEAEVVLADAPGVRALIDLLGRLPTIKRIVAFDDEAYGTAGVELVPFGEVRASEQDAPRSNISCADLVSIMYTSGTTGMPKGCMLPHGYYIRNGRTLRGQFEIRHDDVLLTALPLFHGAAHMGVLMSALSEGISVVIEPGFHATSIIDRWIETRATHFIGVGMMGKAILRQPRSGKDRAHRVRSGFMTPFPPELQQQFLDRFGVNLNTARYGQTECSPAAMSYLGKGKPGSAGKPVPHYDVAVVDRDDNLLPAGEVGEIVVRPKSPNAMYAGYWRQPEATVNAWRNLWHHTGDLGRLDAEGFLYFVDREKDALRRRGENISSMEVETAILTNSKISEAAVIAAPSNLTEDEVMAYLVLADNEIIEPRELFEFFKETMPYFAIPRYVCIVENLPKTAATMRVQKLLLRRQGITADTWDFEEMGLRIQRAERR